MKNFMVSLLVNLVNVMFLDLSTLTVVLTESVLVKANTKEINAINVLMDLTGHKQENASLVSSVLHILLSYFHSNY